MTSHKRNDADPDEYEPAETIILDDDVVMETAEFKKLVGLNDPSLIEEIEPPDPDD